MKEKGHLQRGEAEFANCQLQYLYESASDMTGADKARILARRLLTAFKRRARKLKRPPGAIGPKGKTDKTGIQAPDGGIREGDLVQVLPYPEIEKTLDRNGQCERMTFMEGMKRHSGRTFRVYKKINTMFDEQSWKMVRLKRAVLLQDALCDAHGLYDKEGCDRCCYYFWKEQWLRKVDEQ